MRRTASCWGLNTVVVRTGQHTVVIETGIGDKMPEKMRAIYDTKQLLPQSFAAAGIKLDEVDIVINSHLHFDHCGWNTPTQQSRRSRADFPECPLLRPPR